MALDPYQEEEQKKQAAIQQQTAEQQQQQAEQQKQAVQPPTTPTPAPTTVTAPTPVQTQVVKPAAPPVQPVTQFGPPAQQLQQPTTTRKRTPTPISSYQRLQEYLRTSQPQAQGLSGSVQQDIRSTAAAGSQALGQAAQSFSQKVEEAGLTRNADRTSQLIAKAANLKKGEALTDAELAELQSIASKQQGFEGLAPADLTAISDYATAQQKLGEATTKAELTGTESGREALLSGIYGKQAPYTSGQSWLDQLLTGSTKQSSADLANLREQIVGGDVYGKQLSAAEKAAVAKRLAEQEEVGKATEDVTTGVGMERGQGALGGLEQSILDTVTSENKRVDDINALIDKAMAEGSFTQFGNTVAQKQLIKDMGLTQAQINDIRATGDINKDQIFYKLKKLNEQTATTPDQYAKLQALYKIGDMFNRTSEKLPVEEREDLGTLLGQQTGLDVAKINAAKKQNEEVMKSEILNRGANLKAVKPVDYGFGRDMDTVSASKDIIGRMTDIHFVESDNKEADKVLKVYQDEFASLNATRQARGLQAIPSPTFDDQVFKDTLNSVFKNSWFGAIQWMNGRSPFASLDDLRNRNPAAYSAIVEQAKRVRALEYYNTMFGIDNPVWRR